MDLLLDLQLGDRVVQVGLLGLHLGRREVVEEADVAKDIERGLELVEYRVKVGRDVLLYLGERWLLGGLPLALSLSGCFVRRLSLLWPALVGSGGLIRLE